MNNEINYASITYDTIVDGLGLRNTLYVCGCNHNCTGCHNKDLQNPTYGKTDTVENILNLLNVNDNDLTLSGGEPFDRAIDLSILVKEYKKLNKDLNVWVYSGYEYEQIMQDEVKLSLLKECDVLVDGKFKLDERNIDLIFKGSNNQRIIDIKESLKNNNITLLDIESYIKY